MANKYFSEKYVQVRQPEIDHIRKTGKAPELGLWDQVAQYAKYKGTEWGNDWFNDHHYDMPSDPDSIREQAFNQAKEQALTDHQLSQSGVPGPYSDHPTWLRLKAGQYNK